MQNINVITIEKNVPIPELTWKGSTVKYDFIQAMEITDSFSINGSTPNFTTTSVRAYVYKLNNDTNKTYTIRTLEGRSSKPVAIRVWRVK